MSVYKRGRVFWFDFQFKGQRYCGSTRLKNKVKAELFEAKRRTDLAMGEVGLATPRPSPFLRDFIAPSGPFLQHVRLISKRKVNTIKCYEQAALRVLEFDAIASCRLNLIDKKLIEDFVQWRARKVSITSVNRDLAVLRHAMKLAEEWNYVTRAVRIQLLPGANKREYVLSAALEMKYLEVAPSPLREAAILMLDMGLRPSECLALRKADIVGLDGFFHGHQSHTATRTAPFVTVETGRVPTFETAHVCIREGKTPNARRTLPIPKRSRDTIEFLCAFWPDSEWLFPGRKGHLRVASLDRVHKKVTTETLDEAGNALFPPEFVLYTCRHTMATRLGEICGNPYMVMKVLGHASLKMSERYVHIGADSVERAMRQLEMMNELVRGHEEAPSKLKTS